MSKILPTGVRNNGPSSQCIVSLVSASDITKVPLIAKSVLALKALKGENNTAILNDKRGEMSIFHRVQSTKKPWKISRYLLHKGLATYNASMQNYSKLRMNT